LVEGRLGQIKSANKTTAGVGVKAINWGGGGGGAKIGQNAVVPFKPSNKRGREENNK